MLDKDRVYLVAEIGINHNGDLSRAKALIAGAKASGADAVKFQKRTIEIVYSKEELARPRESPFGKTNGDLKRGLEFSFEQYCQIDDFCREMEIEWYASPWDEFSVEFLEKFDVPYHKIASPCLTDKGLLERAAISRPLMVSTGMANLATIAQAVDVIQGATGSISCLYHCTSTYPTSVDEINLLGVKTLSDIYSSRLGIPVGYSGHEMSITTSVASVLLGARSIERHITISRADWGSDQAASLDTEGFRRLCREVRLIERAMGDGEIRVYDSELPIIDKLRRKNTICS